MKSMFSASPMIKKNDDKLWIKFYYDNFNRKRLLEIEKVNMKGLKKIAREVLGGSSEFELYLDQEFKHAITDEFLNTDPRHLFESAFKIYLKLSQEPKLVKRKIKDIQRELRLKELEKGMGKTKEAFIESFKMLMKQDLVKKYIKKEKDKLLTPEKLTMRDEAKEFMKGKKGASLPIDLIHIKQELLNTVTKALKHHNVELNKKRLRSTY